MRDASADILDQQLAAKIAQAIREVMREVGEDTSKSWHAETICASDARTYLRAKGFMHDDIHTAISDPQALTIGQLLEQCPPIELAA